jgi:hypothetical protein
MVRLKCLLAPGCASSEVDPGHEKRVQATLQRQRLVAHNNAGNM